VSGQVLALAALFPEKVPGTRGI